MLVIRQAQMQQMGEGLTAGFRRRLLELAASLAPDQDVSAIEPLVDAVEAAARGCGIRREKDFALCVRAAALHFTAFEAGIPKWALDMLSDSRVPRPEERAHRLAAEAERRVELERRNLQRREEFYGRS